MLSSPNKNLCEKGSFNSRKCNRCITCEDEAAEVAALGAGADSPHVSA
jgi:hypothetical protein